MNLWTVVAVLNVTSGVGMQNPAAQEGVGQDSVGASAATPAVSMSARISDVMPSAYGEPPCLSKNGLRKVANGTSLLKSALESQAADARAKGLQDAEAKLIELIDKNSQEKNASAWYSLAQVYMYRDNVVGADSALRRAWTLAPGCRASLDELRYAAWAPLMNAGIKLSSTGQSDSALVLLRRAAVMYPTKPQAALNLGVIFAGKGPVDSAIVYFQKASELAERAGTESVDERNRSTFNLAAMLQQAGRHAEAVTVLEKYIGWIPDDKDAKDALAISYRAAGQLDKAQELDKELLAAGGGSASGDSTSAGGAASRAAIASSVAMRVGINYYNEQKFADAAQAFKQVMDAEPHNRDAIYNLANAYMSMKEGPKLIEVGEVLVKIEPMSESALQLLGAGYKNANDINKAIATAEQLVALPADVAVKEFAVRGDGAKLTMTALGRAPTTPAGKAIAATAVVLGFEFLDGAGTVVATQDTEVPALKESATHEFTLDVKGKGILAWRYTKK